MTSVTRKAATAVKGKVIAKRARKRDESEIESINLPPRTRERIAAHAAPKAKLEPKHVLPRA